MTTPLDLVPVTVVGGYLGAGKTTLVNQLLAGDHGRRLAVLVNDFGAVNIDVDLIASHDGETVSLQNGCVCCSIADALGDGLDRVLSLDPPPDQIVIEASGVADPGKIGAYGQGWPGCRLDAVVVLADAETIRSQADDQFVGELVTRQLRRADLVLLTKCDLVAEPRLDVVTNWTNAVTPAPVLPIRHGAIDPALILELSLGPGKGPGHPDIGLDEGRWLVEARQGATAEHLFEAHTLEIGAPLERARLEEVLARWPDDVIRAKGVVFLHEGGDSEPRPHVVHRVGCRLSIEEMKTVAGLELGAGRLVVIGRRGALDRAQLTSGLVES